MPRKERIHIPGAVYHLILRGNDRRDIFADDKDRFRFYSILDNAFQRLPFKIHAFCLMTNHIHLEVQVAETPINTLSHPPRLVGALTRRFGITAR